MIPGATGEILKATATLGNDGVYPTGSKLTAVDCAHGKETKQESVGWGGEWSRVVCGSPQAV